DRDPHGSPSIALQVAGNQTFVRRAGLSALGGTQTHPRAARPSPNPADRLVERALADAAARRTVLQRDTSSPPSPRYKVVIVELGLNRLNEVTREAARTAIDKELDQVAATSKDNKVKPGVDVERRKSLSASEAKAFGTTDFALYLIPKRDADL